MEQTQIVEGGRVERIPFQDFLIRLEGLQIVAGPLIEQSDFERIAARGLNLEVCGRPPV